jgi:hypothetical protein
MTITINGSGTVTGVTTLATTNVSQTLTTPIVTTTIGVGNATPSGSGSGITFPATQSASTNANTLDDYEEGTWTPVLTPATGSITSQDSYGYYTKTGNSVTLLFAVTVLNGGTASGLGTLTGLPFTAQTVSPSLGGNRAGTCSVREDGVTGIWYFGYVDSNNTRIVISTSANAALNYANNACYMSSFVYRSTN